MGSQKDSNSPVTTTKSSKKGLTAGQAATGGSYGQGFSAGSGNPMDKVD